MTGLTVSPAWSDANQRVLVAEFARLRAAIEAGDDWQAQLAGVHAAAVDAARRSLPAPAAIDVLAATFEPDAVRARSAAALGRRRDGRRARHRSARPPRAKDVRAGRRSVSRWRCSTSRTGARSRRSGRCGGGGCSSPKGRGRTDWREPPAHRRAHPALPCRRQLPGRPPAGARCACRPGPRSWPRPIAPSSATRCWRLSQAAEDVARHRAQRQRCEWAGSMSRPRSPRPAACRPMRCEPRTCPRRPTRSRRSPRSGSARRVSQESPCSSSVVTTRCRPARFVSSTVCATACSSSAPRSRSAGPAEPPLRRRPARRRATSATCGEARSARRAAELARHDRRASSTQFRLSAGDDRDARASELGPLGRLRHAARRTALDA